MLEEYFNLGVRFDVLSALSIRDSMMQSAIVCFSTSENGWKQVKKGEFLEFPSGLANGSHSSLVEGYDLDKNCYICKNSWGGKTAEPRFDFTESAPHNCWFIRVYFTPESIVGKTSKFFTLKIKKFGGSLNGIDIDCAWMDKITANYCDDYVCELKRKKHGQYKYIGYNVNQWISINLNRSKFSN